MNDNISVYDKKIYNNIGNIKQNQADKTPAGPDALPVWLFAEREFYLVPKIRSPASPRPGTM